MGANTASTVPTGNPAAGKLQGRVALVAGATRGVGRGIARAFGEAGATVYCTGRSTRANRAGEAPHQPGERGGAGTKLWPADYYASRPETIEETAELVAAAGGNGIAVPVDHLEPAQVANLIAQIRREQGRLDFLVNDISESAEYAFGEPFWKIDFERGFAMFRNGIYTHMLTSHFAAPLMMETAKPEAPGLIVEIGDGDSYTYRGHMIFDLVKTTVIRLAFGMARELRRKNIAAVALTPGFLRSEAMLEHFGVTEANWRDAIKKDSNYAVSETPLFAGRAIACLAADPEVMKKSGRAFSSWRLSDEYHFTDADGSRPHWGKHARATFGDILKPCDEGFYQYWVGGPVDTMFGEWP
jgi:NAD(P)-dependent dehydrogenase (short-subunit alcohol dehydrogenase family)